MTRYGKHGDFGNEDSFQGQLLHVRDEKAQSTDGGTFTLGAWRTRDLNTTKTNEILGASLSTNQITLPPGVYYCVARAPAYAVAQHQSRVYDTTGSAVLITGSNTLCDTSALNNSHSAGRFTLSVESIIELQHRCTATRADNGFGTDMNYGTEIYSEVQIWKVK
jgi:hypothetical protein